MKELSAVIYFVSFMIMWVKDMMDLCVSGGMGEVR